MKTKKNEVERTMIMNSKFILKF